MSPRDEVQRTILFLKRIGFSYRGIARSIGVSHSSIIRWIKSERQPKDPTKILKNLTRLIDNDKLILVDDYYSYTHNGPPNNYFSIRPGDNHLIERFKRSIKLIADLLDIENSKLLDHAAKVGIEYLKENKNMKLYGIKMRSFALACFRIVMYQQHYVYPDWNKRLYYMSSINLIDLSIYREFFTKLSSKNLA